MNRRQYLILLGGTTALIPTAGCLGDDAELIEGDAEENIHSTSRISNILPGEWEYLESRPPGIDPVGLRSIDIIRLSGPDQDDMLDYGVALFDEIEEAETFYGYVYSETDDPREEGIGHEAFSFSIEGYDGLNVRYANAWIQIVGTPHISNQRELANEQLYAF